MIALPHASVKSVLCLVGVAALSWVPSMSAQKLPVNYDEAKVPPYTLPDPLRSQEGAEITTVEAWQEKRKPELRRLFEAEVYGRTPLGRPPEMRFQPVAEKPAARDGKAIRVETDVLFFGREDGPKMRVLLYLPAKATGPVPVFLGLNFEGNHVVTKEPDIALPNGWVPNNRGAGLLDNQPSEKTRGCQADRWQIDYALEHGYGVATAYYGDIDPDFDDGFSNGVHAVTGKPQPGEWGSIGAWAWGLSRALDWLETDGRVDRKKVIVMGHSRLGKTALWAGAQDERFALIISNNSGAGGAALSRRIFGETIAILNQNFPHWFTDGYKRWSHREADCPVDQHQLIALLAPRPVLITSATEDRWADPKGEYLSGVAAGPVYSLFGKTAPQGEELPSPETLVDTTVGYFLRTGAHDVTLADWQAYVRFADKHLR